MNSPKARSEVRLRRGPRRSSSQGSAVKGSCTSLPRSIEALDLVSSSPVHALASLRFLVLSYLADLERQLTEVESPSLETWKFQGELTLEEGKQWANTALEMLEGIRADVCSHFPDFNLVGLSSMEDFVVAHLPDMPDVPTLTDMRSHLPDIQQMRTRWPDMPTLPDMDEVLSDVRLKIDDVRTRFNELDFRTPFNFIPVLSERLEHLHSHLDTMDVPSGLPVASFAPNSVLSNLMESLMKSDFVKEIIDGTPDVVGESEELIERTVIEVNDAVKRSLNGVSLIKYSDLPHAWRNNPFVTHGYRFIPLNRWPLLIMSLFSWHNEIINIHTHLIPFLVWGINLTPLYNDAFSFDTPEILFMSFALLCLLCSSVWHTMAGCAHRGSMEFCARVDYVGIGWLISASVATVVHYGFHCHPNTSRAFLGLCFSTGVAGNVLPFMKWFDKFEYRLYRIAFFLSLAFAALGPLVTMAILHSTRETLDFIAPVVPSLISYLVGLGFYASHFPERLLPEDVRKRLDMYGGSSHAIWHMFIVLAVYLHKTSMASMRNGLQCKMVS
ncbi:hemolysin-III related-domain-containing protein [Crepidotus variabilis]|uniref:Hemolysin-III related-domain-containing protein n=1 Tax=Crepidotus variabilis TaxID=179855 RepID=A0A9P6EEL3_9AGAR|nr:hemolysin-III related-domain-containing protein [Crepidotus variabilis]